MIGLIPGVIRLVVGFIFFKPPCGTEDLRPSSVIQFINGIHYLHYGAILFVITGIVTVIISLYTEPIPDERLHCLTFWTRKSTEFRKEHDEDHDTSNIVSLRHMEKKSSVDFILNVLAVLSMSLACFVIGFFA